MKKLVSRYLLPLFFYFLIAACSDNTYTPLNNNATILAFGDSLTYGVGAGKNRTYPDALAALTGLKVINAGISGETTTQGIKRFEATLNKHFPDLIILLEGGNDILRNHDQKITKTNLSQMIEIAQSQNIPVVLIGVPEKKLFSSSAPFYQELAQQYQVIFDGDILSDLLRSSEFKSDAIHLNSAGYKEFATHIYELLREKNLIASVE